MTSNSLKSYSIQTLNGTNSANTSLKIHSLSLYIIKKPSLLIYRKKNINNDYTYKFQNCTQYLFCLK